MPITSCGGDGTKAFSVHSAPGYILQLMVFLVLASSDTLLHGQTVEIKLLNGRTGSPLAGTCVNVWVGNERRNAMAIPTDQSGVAKLRLTDHDGETDFSRRWKECGEFGVVEPVVKYGDSIRINAGYVLCQPHAPDHSWLFLTNISTNQLIQSGIVTPNSCGKATASPKSREMIIFVRPLNWWEKLKQ